MTRPHFGSSVTCELRTEPGYYELFLLCDIMRKKEDLSKEERKGIISMALESASVLEIAKKMKRCENTVSSLDWPNLSQAAS